MRRSWTWASVGILRRRSLGAAPVCSSPVKAGKLMKQAEKALKASRAIDHWQKDREEIEAEDLLMHAMDVDEVDPEDDVPAGARKRFERMIARRVTGEPVQFIRGFAEFRGLELIAKPGVFIPRDSSGFLA